MTAITNLGKLDELRHQVNVLQQLALEDPRQVKQLLPALLASLQGSLQDLEAAAAPDSASECTDSIIAAGSNGQHVVDHRLDHAQRFRALSDQGRVLVRIVNGANHCRWVNRAWRGFTGRSTKELLGEGWLGQMHRDDREHYAEACREAFESGRIYRMEYRLQHGDGEYGWVLEIGSPRLDQQGKIGGFIGVATEISELEQTRGRPELHAALAQVLPEARHAGSNGHSGNGNGNGSRPRE